MTSTLDRSRSVHVHRALVHAAHPSTWRDAMAIGRADATIAPAIRVGIAATVVLVAGGLLGRADLAGFATLGAVCSAFGRYEAYPRRAGKLALVGLLTVMFAALGAAVGASGAPTSVQIVVVALSSGVAALLVSAFAITGPGPVILVFCATAAVGFSHAWSDVAVVALATLAGVVVGWIAAMLPALFHPVGPAQLAVARALAAVSAQLESRGPSASGAIAHARTVVALGGTRHRTSDHSRALLALLDDADTVADAAERGDGARGDAARGDGARGDGAESENDESRASELLGHERELRRIRKYTALVAPMTEAPMTEAPMASASSIRIPAGFFGTGLRALTSRPLVVNALRIAAAATAAAWCATLVGFEHPLWAAMGAVATMQGITFETTVRRGIQRLVGNIAGAAIAAVLLALSLGYWQAVVAIVLTQVAAELLVMKNYALTSLAVTPMALLLTGLASNIDPDIAISRIGDTLIGVLIGIFVAAVTIDVPAAPTAPARA